jgi:hypothetical protein
MSALSTGITKRKIKLIVVCGVLSSLGGCASPLVQYRRITGPDSSGAQKFKFAASVITFSHPSNKDGQPSDAISITSVPIEASGDVYSIAGTGQLQNWGVSTEIDVTHRGDTKLIQSIGVAVTDNRPNDISELGSIAAAAAALAAGANLPNGIDLSAEILDAKNPSCTAPDGESGLITCKDVPLQASGVNYSADLVIQPIPTDAISFSSAGFPTFTSANFLYSACRNATVVLKAGPSVLASAPIVVADPNFLETIRFPSKGKITVGASCGADSTSSDAALPDGLSYVNTLLTTAQKVRTALNKTPAPTAK